MIDQDKKIYFNVPKSKSVYDFLNNYEFFHFLRHFKVKSNVEKYKKPYNPVITPMFPLTFNYDVEFKHLLEELKDPDRLNIILKDISDAEIVKSNAIHTIILKEISDNVFIHLECKSANMIMTRLPKPYIQSNQIVKERVSDFELDFFINLSGNKYINLVIADSEIGLYKSLIEPYLKDQILPKRLKISNPTEVDLIKYAFLKHSTSRTDEERKSSPPNLFDDSGIMEYPLPTGLFEVYNTVKRYKGFMYVRSGKSIVCYDFLSGLDGVIVKSNEDVKGYKKLSNFPGVQFKFYFPVDYQYEDPYFKYSQQELFEDRESLNFHYISVNDFVEQPFNVELKNDLSKIKRIKDKATGFYIENENRKSLLTFDAGDFLKKNYKNIIHYIVSHLMDLQNENIKNILFNIDPKKVSELQSIFSDVNYRKLPPLFVIDKYFNVDIIGLENAELEILNSQTSKNYTFNVMEDIVDKYEYYFKLHDGKLLFNFP